MSINKEVNIFISCTFRDIEPERSLLENIVFPSLNDLCKKNGITINSINLGWGAFHYGGDPDEALDMCLSNVAKCNYFIGILGEQYGTEFFTSNKQLLNKYPWLTEKLGKSFVELECIYGCFNRPSNERRSLFYFRSFSNDIRNPKLLQLKQAILEKEVIVREYNETYLLPEIILHDLWNLIEKDNTRK